MKTRNSTRTLLVLLMLAVGGQGCGGHDPSAPVLRAPIDPVRQPDELSRRLSIIGQNRSGAFPAPSQQGPRILLIQASASVTPDNTLFLPFSYRSDSAVRGLYLSVVGAKNYWDIPLGADDAVHDRVVPIGIPAEALPGDFVLEYSLYDASGQVGARSRLHASVVPPTAGPGGSIEFPRVEGHDGLTVRTYDVGTAAGLVTNQRRVRLIRLVRRQHVVVGRDHRQVRRTLDHHTQSLVSGHGGKGMGHVRAAHALGAGRAVRQLVQPRQIGLALRGTAHADALGQGCNAWFHEELQVTDALIVV